MRNGFVIALVALGALVVGAVDWTGWQQAAGSTVCVPAGQEVSVAEADVPFVLNLGTIELAAGAKVVIGDSALAAAAQSASASKPNLRLASGASLELGDGEFACSRARYDGVQVVTGLYCSASAPVAGATAVGWLSGAGRLKVTRSYSGLAVFMAE